MKCIFICALAAQLGLPLVSRAQVTDPSDAGLAVPAALYVSVFKGGIDAREMPTPDKIWRGANAAMLNDDDQPATGAQPHSIPNAHEHHQHSDQGE
ncbi:MAG TPA: hypothetical protein VHL60_06890 [Oxalicibacterium sp.]|nr:hypothetical protein [Oxalicibacterium sp.]